MPGRTPLDIEFVFKDDYDMDGAQNEDYNMEDEAPKGRQPEVQERERSSSYPWDSFTFPEELPLPGLQTALQSAFDGNARHISRPVIATNVYAANSSDEGDDIVSDFSQAAMYGASLMGNNMDAGFDSDGSV